jgi:hypothetical protein
MKVRHAPPRVLQFMHTVCPNVWKSGSAPRTTSFGPMSNSVSRETWALRRRFS